MTNAQAQAAKAVYAGPTTSRGESIYTGGLEPGSELGWPDLSSSFGPRIAEFFRYMSFVPDPGPNWKLSDFDFDRDYKRLGGMNVLYTASNPDLRKFKAAGGKLIVYHGWADKAVTPKDSIDYHDTVEKTMGGRAATQDFFRLFMVPAMEHCSGGDGAFAVDYLSYLESWVENGEAPDKMVGAHVQGMDWVAALGLQFPLDTTTNVSFTRPLYPYPMLAWYKGSGDPDKAASFRAVGQ